MSEKSVYALQQLGASLLSLALKNLFPSSQFSHCGTTSVGFFACFKKLPSLPPDFLHHIEREMWDIIKKDPEIQVLHMMRENCGAFLKHHKLPILADKAMQSEKNIIDLIQIGSFYSLLENDDVADLADIGGLTCYQMEVKDEEIFVFGSVFSSKMALKAFTKKNDHARRFIAIQRIEEEEILERENGQLYWKEKGLILKDNFLNLWKQLLGNHQFKRFDSSAICKVIFKNFNGVLKLAQWQELVDEPSQYPIDLGLLTKTPFSRDLLTVVCPKIEGKQYLISSLQFIRHFIKLFEFEWCATYFAPSEKKGRSPTLKGIAETLVANGFSNVEVAKGSLKQPLLQIYWFDLAGRKWPGPFLNLEEEQENVFISFSLLGSFERLVALLLEQHKPWPVWLAHEQVRVVSVSQEHNVQAKQLFAQLKEKGIRVVLDCANIKLALKIRDAEWHKVPFVLAVGESELAGELSVRRSGEAKPQRLSFDQFLEELK
ncbi:MAG: hypothetical protein JHC93_06355 [Parachlamydiales bacterium]|nr:hypothetical protein [Parachlamydiales bacterium]